MRVEHPVLDRVSSLVGILAMSDNETPTLALFRDERLIADGSAWWPRITQWRSEGLVDLQYASRFYCRVSLTERGREAADLIEGKRAAVYTVVYEVTGGRETHNEWWRMISRSPDGIKVIATASFDALAKLDELEEQHV